MVEGPVLITLKNKRGGKRGIKKTTALQGGKRLNPVLNQSKKGVVNSRCPQIRAITEMYIYRGTTLLIHIQSGAKTCE